MRLFIALLPDERIREELVKIQEEMQDKGIAGNYLDASNLHITLAFIGEYGDPEQVMDLLEEIEFSPFSLTLDKVGKFAHGPMWCGVKESKELKDYARRLRHTLADHGIPFDPKPVVPHITLVRKPVFRREEYPEIFVPSAVMDADRVSLMRSDRGKHGMIYTEIFSFDGQTE